MRAQRCEAITSTGQRCLRSARFTVAGRSACGNHRSGRFEFIQVNCDNTCKHARAHRAAAESALSSLGEVLLRDLERVERSAAAIEQAVRESDWLFRRLVQDRRNRSGTERVD